LLDDVTASWNVVTLAQVAADAQRAV